MKVERFMGQGLVDFEPHVVMTGEERYPIVGDLLTEEQAALAMTRCEGLQLYGDCLRKAVIAAEILGHDHVWMGSLWVYGLPGDPLKGITTYGFEFNLPFEFHAWVGSPSALIDIALPGVIMRAKQHCDDLGPMLPLMNPVILAGPTRMWCRYKCCQAASIEEALRLAGG